MINLLGKLDLVTSFKANPLSFQELILRLQAFWAERGCVLQQPHDVEVGAGTMAPETFLRVLGAKPYKVAYVQPSRRPADGRYGENPNRLYKHMQMQVILKPPPENVQELYLESLVAIGIDLRQHDLKFEEDNWESPTLNAWGVGWQVMLDGLEITQFTYFQQCGGVDLDPISAELTYGLERIGAFLQDVDSIYDIVWARDPVTGGVTTYRDVRLADELQYSVYNFEVADVEKAWKHFDLCEAECKSLLDQYAALKKEKSTGLLDKKRFPLLERLRSLSEVFAPVQYSRCARCDFRNRAGGCDCSSARVGGRNCQGLCGPAIGSHGRYGVRTCGRERDQGQEREVSASRNLRFVILSGGEVSCSETSPQSKDPYRRQTWSC